MVYCQYCKAHGKKIKLIYDSEDKYHPFKCLECGDDMYEIDPYTNTFISSEEAGVDRNNIRVFNMHTKQITKKEFKKNQLGRNDL